MATIQYYGTGRRKTAVARVYLRQGSGVITVNSRTFDDYFPNRVLKMVIRQPLLITETADKFDVYVKVNGGGAAGQAGAIRHGITPAISPADRNATARGNSNRRRGPIRTVFSGKGGSFMGRRTEVSSQQGPGRANGFRGFSQPRICGGGMPG